MFDLLSFSITILAGVFILVLILPMFIQINIVEQLSRILYNLSLSVGAIMGGFAGLQYIESFLIQKRINSKIKEIARLYSESQYLSSWDLIRLENDPRVFIRELKTNIIHHVRNYQTFLDLSFNSHEVKPLNKSDFEKCTISDENYDTRK